MQDFIVRRRRVIVEEERAPEAEQMEGEVQNEEQRVEMREFSRPMLAASGSCIRLGPAARNYELKSMHLNMLPSFHGLSGEDPLNFIRDFYSIVEQMPLQGLNEDQLRMRCFPYCLKERAKAWLMSLAPNSLQTWEDIFHKFNGKYYSHQKTTSLRQEREPFHEAWERFKQLQLEYPHHHYSVQLLNQFFYDGLNCQNQCMVDSAAGGTVGVKTTQEIMDLFEMLGANSQQKSTRSEGKGSTAHEATSVSSLASHIEKLIETVQFLARNERMVQHNQREQCNACGELGHRASQCNMMQRMEQEDGYEQAHWMNSQYQQGNGHSSNTYNRDWRNHPNLSWKRNNVQNPTFQKPQFQNHQRILGDAHQQRSLEDTVYNLVKSMKEMRAERDREKAEHEREKQGMSNTIRRLEMQLGQVAEKVQDTRQGKLPSQSEQAKAVTTLRSGKQVNNGISLNNDDD